MAYTHDVFHDYGDPHYVAVFHSGSFSNQDPLHLNADVSNIGHGGADAFQTGAQHGV